MEGGIIMKYRSKKDPEVTAAFDFQDEKTKVNHMIYLTGEKAGYAFEISSSTLKRWWTKVDATQEEINSDIINAPYHPNVTPHYIPVPDSVKEYEAMKTKKRRNNDLPDFESMVEEFAVATQRINESSKYIALKDSQTTIWRKSTCIDIYADEMMWERFVVEGLESKPNKDAKRPFAIKVKTEKDYERMRNAIIR